MSLKSTAKIYNKLNDAMRTRRLSATVVGICREANVSCATFYTHFASCEDARNVHENELEAEIMGLLPHRLHEREVIFTILLSFLRRHRQYFLANFQAGNIYLIRRILRRLKQILADSIADERTYEIYIGVIISILEYWVECAHHDEAAIERYTKQLMRIPIYRFEF